jgi:hypothetical protein
LRHSESLLRIFSLMAIAYTKLIFGVKHRGQRKARGGQIYCSGEIGCYAAGARGFLVLAHFAPAANRTGLRIHLM